MSNPLIIFRIGWMDAYHGVAEIHGGGAYVEKNKNGLEMWNFREEDGKYHGWVMTNKFAGIDLYRLEPDRNWVKGDELNGVDVVFISRKNKQVVIGWYKNATVFHKEYRHRKNQEKYWISGNEDKEKEWQELQYLCEVESENGFLLMPSERDFEIPRGPGFPGQSNVWYENHQNRDVVNFIKRLRKYMDDKETVTVGKSVKRKRIPDKAEILAIEKAAIENAWGFYESQGYAVSSVEKDNVGWDLEAVKEKEKLCIEVKGHKGNIIQFELTPNEYARLKQTKNYRICMVRNALTSPELTEFYPKKKKGTWYLFEKDGNERVRLDEKIAVRAVPIDS